ncbi:MAG TPA: glycosyltransferase family 4 protein, partial [Methanospirillum sp.]|uniref:glycosyltransferase n=1 Tax=Methanospirillum sp. TaxID=45200 RepID=UPI002BD7B6CE
GVPVIGSNIGGIPDIIEDGVNGLLVPPGDPKALADAIIKILNHPQMAEKFIREGLKTVHERFSWDKISDQFIKLYQEVLHEPCEI